MVSRNFCKWGKICVTSTLWIVKFRNFHSALPKSMSNMAALAPSTSTFLPSSNLECKKDTVSVTKGLNLSAKALYLSSSASLSTFKLLNRTAWQSASDRNFSENLSKSPRRSDKRIPFLVIFEEYVGPMPFLVVPRDLLFSDHSVSCRPSTAYK